MSYVEGILPKALVIDLDYTVWKGDCGLTFLPPFTTGYVGSNVYDRSFRLIEVYPYVHEILSLFYAAGVKIAFASRNQNAAVCEDLLKRFGLWHYGSMFLAMSSGSSNSKDPHFAIIKERLGIEYEDMMFVDDLSQNIMAAKKLGVTAVLCNQYKGLDWEYIDMGLIEFRAKKSGTPIETVESKADQWERHKQWAIECESLKADFYEKREKWWKEKYGCKPVPMCIYDCISLTDCYHGKTI